MNQDLLKTKRLTLLPMTDEEMQILMDAQQDAELRQAYSEMLAGSIAHPGDRKWHAAWQIRLKDGSPVGDLCFKGKPIQGEVEIGYGILPACEGCGYATEAVEAAVNWAFTQPDTVLVSAQTEPSNAASQRVLAKAGFVPDGEGREGPRFVREKPASNWMVIYLALGLGVGTSLSAASGNMALGSALGLCIGLAIGLALDTQEKKQRDTLRKAREAGNANQATQ